MSFEAQGSSSRLKRKDKTQAQGSGSILKLNVTAQAQGSSKPNLKVQAQD